MAEVKFVDTTLRDGQSSLWGYRMTTEMILPIADQLEIAGFEAIEADSFNTMKMRALQQKEDAWARIRLLARKIKKTHLLILAGPTFGNFIEPVPLSIARIRAERLAANGIRRVQVNGVMNDMKFKIPEMVHYSREAGLEVQIGLIFAISPKHTDEYYAGKTLEALELKPDLIYLKDPIGLLTPERTRTIIPAILQKCGDTPLELHSHCTTGLAPLCYLEAIEAGVRVFHTGIPPLANGPAQPSVFNIAKNSRLFGHSPRIDEEALRRISDHFCVIAKREGLTIGSPLEYDHAQFLHQVPGGVVSNMKRQLSEVGIGHKFREVLEETTLVRKDFGYPIMYTPFSQFVVTQAMLNVVLGERYKVVPDEVIKYVLGHWGEETSSGVEAEVKSKILDRPLARVLARQGTDEAPIEEIRQKLGGSGIPDDDLLMRYMIGGEERLQGLRPADSISEYPSTKTPLIWLIEQSLKQKSRHYIKVEKGDLRLIMQKTGG